MNQLYEDRKIDIGLVAQALNDDNATGAYYSMRPYHKAIAVLNGGAMAATKSTAVEFLQATDAAGSDSKVIVGAAAIITANTLVTEATLTLDTVLNGEAVTINGLTFTGHTDTTTYASREFKIDGNDTADAAALVSCINHATYGVPGVTASSDGAVVTLKSTEPGATLITISDAAATITAATTQAQAYAEVQNYSLDHAGGFTHVAVKVTTTANTVVGAVLERGCARDAIVQKVGASAAV